MDPGDGLSGHQINEILAEDRAKDLVDDMLDAAANRPQLYQLPTPEGDVSDVLDPKYREAGWYDAVYGHRETLAEDALDVALRHRTFVPPLNSRVARHTVRRPRRLELGGTARKGNDATQIRYAPEGWRDLRFQYNDQGTIRPSIHRRRQYNRQRDTPISMTGPGTNQRPLPFHHDGFNTQEDQFNYEVAWDLLEDNPGFAINHDGERARRNTPGFSNSVSGPRHPLQGYDACVIS